MVILLGMRLQKAPKSTPFGRLPGPVDHLLQVHHLMIFNTFSIGRSSARAIPKATGAIDSHKKTVDHSNKSSLSTV